MVSTTDMVARFKKDYGDNAGGFGAELKDCDRVPSGCFELDLATGGGFPKGYLSIIYGPESSGKTNCALRAVANHQMLWPEQHCVWMAVEPFDPAWASAMGVDVDRLVVMKPDFAEQCVDQIEGFLGAEDVGLIAVDSIAAMYTSTSVEKSAEDAVMGGIGVVMSRLCDKITHEIRLAEKQDRSLPTVIFINQIRTKVGVVFGSPLSMPGGHKQKFLSSLTVRVTGKNIMDNKISQVLPVRKEMQFVLEKWKVPIVAVNGRFEMAMRPHNNLEIGECEDSGTVMAVLKSSGEMEKSTTGTGWVILGETYPTQQAFRERLVTDKLFGLKVKQDIIKNAVGQGGVVPQ